MDEVKITLRMANEKFMECIAPRNEVNSIVNAIRGNEWIVCNGLNVNPAHIIWFKVGE